MGQPALTSTPDVDALIHAHAPIAIGVSGGRDSQACAIETVQYARQRGHAGPIVLIHSDLGRVEWPESIEVCRELARHLGLELIVVSRAAGDLMDRWLTRWANNIERYHHLECVKVILPWSTASMRFCTSELKTAVICRELVRRFPGQTILSVTGIRREESPNRRRAPIVAMQPKLTSVTHATTGYNWNPLLDYRAADVAASIADAGLTLHPAYTVFGASRVSCAFCILAGRDDLRASTLHPANLPIYGEMCDLELSSTFSFQDRHWLSDVAPQHLSDGQRARVPVAKALAAQRERIEAQIPAHLLYVKGWPTIMPTHAEAALLAQVRTDVAGLLGLQVQYTTAAAVLGRYAELIALARSKERA